jgi:tetratricopeptide (TPR) repeat protein
MAQTWMAAANQNGIPAAFLVGRDGRVLWVGHPMGDLDKVIGQVLDGTYDESAAAKQFKDQQDAAAKDMADAKAFNAAMMPVGAALKAKDYKGAIGELDKVLAVHPEYTMRLETIKFNLLLRSDEPAAYAYAKDIASKDPYKNDAQALNSLAWAIVDDQAKLKNPDFAVGLAIAQQAVDVSKGEDPMILDTLAVAYSRSGNLDKAIEVEQKAVALLDKAPYPDETKAEIRKRLDTFKQKKG